MKELVYMNSNRIDSVPYTTSDIIAESAGVQHHTVTRLIQNHISDIEEFGILRFKIEEIKGRGQPERHYELNEEQATLVITYLKNTAPVRAFKKALVHEFFKMRSELMKRQVYREQLKPIRRELTDVIKDIPNENEWAYSKYQNLAYIVVVGNNATVIRKKRNAKKSDPALDYMTAEELEQISKVEYKIGVLLESGFDYHQIKDILLSGQTVKTGA